MKILGQRNENVYLLVEDGVSEIEEETQARILDDRQNLLFPWELGHSLLARGYWSDYEGGADLDAMLDRADEVTY